MPLSAANAVIWADAYWVPLSELNRSRFNSDYVNAGPKLTPYCWAVEGQYSVGIDRLWPRNRVRVALY